VLIADLAEDAGHGRHADAQLGLQRQDFESQVANASQGAEIAQHIGKGGAAGAQRQTRPPRGPYISSSAS